MTRDEVIKGLECCLPAHDPDCNLCPYDSIDLRCRAKLRDDIIALLKAQEPVEARLNLCDSCTKEFAECEAGKDDLVFVRCKDCKHYNTTGCSAGFGWCEDSVVNTGTCDDFYCARGERRDDDGEDA